MSGVFTPCFQCLPSAQQHLWPHLRAAAELGFVLYGGTAVSLRLGHRTSVDFDFSCDEPLDRRAMCAAFPWLPKATVLQDEANTLSLLVQGDDPGFAYVKVSFFGAIRFRRVGEPDMTDDGVLLVASLEDLLATKVKVILQRAEAKDYRDIAEMIKANVNLPKALAAARVLFGPNFQPSESLKALVYFNDGDLCSLRREERETLVKAASAVRDLPPVTTMSARLAG